MNALYTVVGALIGALVWAFANPKLGELGRILFAAALFALMFALAGRSVHLF